MKLIDILLSYFIRLIIWMINQLPLKARMGLFHSIIKIVFFLMPSMKKISLKNLALAFPEKTPEEHQAIYSKSLVNLARVFVDFARLSTLGPEWVKDHITCPYLPRFIEMKKSNPNKGVLIATGHLGSFELLAHTVAMFGYPLSFIVRNFKLPHFDAWWTAQREAYGNKVIPRTGAVKVVLKNIEEGKDVALLFDQNVKRNHAVFVDHFGKPAATTMTLGLTAVRTEAPVIVSTIRYNGDDQYEIVTKECDCSDVYQMDNISIDDKVKIITQRTTSIFEQMVKEYPEGWFWMHRRWKTRPEGEKEDFYES